MVRKFKERKNNMFGKKVSIEDVITNNSKNLHAKVKLNPMAIIHFKEKEATRILNENEFMKLMMVRPGSKQWKTIDYIQGYIPCTKTTMNIVQYQYSAPINEENPKEAIQYSLKAFENDDLHDVQKRAKKICTLIGYYLSKEHNIVSKYISLVRKYFL